MGPVHLFRQGPLPDERVGVHPSAWVVEVIVVPVHVPDQVGPGQKSHDGFLAPTRIGNAMGIGARMAGVQAEPHVGAVDVQADLNPLFGRSTKGLVPAGPVYFVG